MGRSKSVLICSDAGVYADRVIFLADGRIVDTLERPTAEAVAALALGVSVIATMTLVLAAASGRSAYERPERDPGPQLLRPGSGRARRPARPRARLALRRVRPVRSDLRSRSQLGQRDCRRWTGGRRQPCLGGHRRRITDLHDRWHRQPQDGEQPIFFTDAEAARLSPGLTRW
jgi:hypothetical protein